MTQRKWRRTIDLKLVAPDAPENVRAGPACASSCFMRAMVAATNPPEPGDTGLVGCSADSSGTVPASGGDVMIPAPAAASATATGCPAPSGGLLRVVAAKGDPERVVAGEEPAGEAPALAAAL